MKTYNHLYEKIYSISDLILAFRKARKGKIGRKYVIEFQENFMQNITRLHEELKSQTYSPKTLETFILRDPKTRKISKADFRDRIVHHAIVNIIESIFDRTFIYDSCANRIGKGNIFALKRFDLFKRKVSGNGKVIENKVKDSNFVRGYCLKADIRHYFQEVNHEILLEIIKRKIKDERVILLIKKILENGKAREGIGMPLGNLTSQFFANVYLNELDYFAKHELKAKYYIRYVDDFVILHNSKIQLEVWKLRIDRFLREKLNLELHPEKSKVIPLSQGIDFVGFRSFYHFRLLRKRNITNMRIKLILFSKSGMGYWQLMESFQGWNAYAIWANSYKLRKGLVKRIYSIRRELDTHSSVRV